MINDLSELSNGFIYISSSPNKTELLKHPFPYPSKESGLQTTSTIVDSARGADGVFRGEIIGNNISKVELTWKVLNPTVWQEILEIMRQFVFYCRFYSMEYDTWVTKKFYVGDRTAKPYWVDDATGRPKYWLDCKANIIDVGEGFFDIGGNN